MTVRHLLWAMAIGIATSHSVPGDEILVSVTGKVTLNGKPLVNGRIFFFLEGDEFVGSEIKDDAYKVSRVPVGECRVVVEGEGVPAKYASEETSVLRVSLKEGKNTIDFNLVGR